MGVLYVILENVGRKETIIGKDVFLGSCSLLILRDDVMVIDVLVFGKVYWGFYFRDVSVLRGRSFFDFC